VSSELIEKKIAKIREYLDVLDGLKDNCVGRMKSDKIYRGSVLYYLYIVADSCVALAEMIIKSKNLPKPQSYAEAIDILGSQKIIPDDFAYDFAKIAGFRNFLAHDYEKISYEEICQYLISRTDSIRQYLQYIESKI
jgi:uncharacterized protein YutE (UPF0331/DUF86 family)